ncbi:MAG TPA: hypothetical protein VF733_05370 [Candidatus Saccharimonadales bacterium]
MVSDHFEHPVRDTFEHLQRLTNDKDSIQAARHPGFKRLVEADLLDGSTEVSQLYKVASTLPGGIMKTVFLETVTYQGLEAALAHPQIVSPLLGVIQISLSPAERDDPYAYYCTSIFFESEKQLYFKLEQNPSPYDPVLTMAASEELNMWNIGCQWTIDIQADRADLDIVAGPDFVSAINRRLFDLS